MESFAGRPRGLNRTAFARRFGKGIFFPFAISLALFCIASNPARALDPNQPPGANFDLSHWYLGIPESPSSIPAAQLIAGYTSAWFYTASNGAMVFWCPVSGGTTANSSFPRSELREQINPPDNSVNWPAQGTHILDAQCKVTVLPSTGKIIVGQIHSYLGEARPLLKLVFDNGTIDAQVKESPTDAADLHVNFPNVPFNSLITYRILFTDGLLSMTVNGVTRSVNVYDSDPEWEDQTFYFKAGAYVQDNEGPSSEGGRVEFYQLSASHSSGASAPPSITKQPGSQGVQVSSNAVLNVSALGGLPLSYQWWKEGAEIPGATNSILPFNNAQLTDAGPYSVVITNSMGAVTSIVAVLTVVTNEGPISMAEAVDTTNLIWTTSGAAPWEPRYGVAPDGIDAARSGRIDHEEDTTLQTTVVGPGTVTFWWRVSSELGEDLLTFYVGSSEQAVISGNVDWQKRTFNVPSGNQVLRWTYSKSEETAVAGDEGWIDQVRFGPQPPTITSQPISQSVDSGTTVAFNVTATGAPPLSYQWQRDGVALLEGNGTRGTMTSSLFLSNVQPAQAGSYSVVISNVAETVTSSNALLAVTLVLPLSEALDTLNVGWATNPAPGPYWVGQTLDMHDGEDSARSGNIGHGKTTSMQTTVSGPGTVGFWWKASSETNKDYVIFYVGSSEQARISGEVGWQPRTFNVPSGNQVLRWTYSKNSSVTAGLDRGFVDEVQFRPQPPTITRHPASQDVDAGSTVSLSVLAAGAPPLSYQWQLDGTDLLNGDAVRGATTATLTLSNVPFSLAGTYSVIVSNATDSVISSNATLMVSPVVPLAKALDTPASLTWLISGTPPWVGQTNVTHDEVDAARSGAVADSQSTSMQTTVVGPGSVSFWWKVSSEPSNDRLLFYVNGSERARITGESNWHWRTFTVSSGSQILKWTYSKNSSRSAGLDRGWVDEVLFIPNNVPTAPIIAVQPVSQSVEPQTTVMLNVGAVGSTPMSYQWLCNGNIVTNGGGISGATTATLILANVQPAQAGTYSVVVSNGVDSVPSVDALLAVSDVLSLAEALETPGLVWTTIGTPPWIGQANVMHDGEDAARSGLIGDSKTTSMQAIVQGPGTVSFWWKVSSQPSDDRLLFYVNGSEKARIVGEVPWQWRTFSISSGNQTLRWTYSKNSSTSVGLDRGWVDQVEFLPAAAPSPFFFTPTSVPVVPEITVVDGIAVLAWNTAPGKFYQVLYKDSLSDDGWQLLAAMEGAAESVASVTDLVEGRSQRFYRVIEE